MVRSASWAIICQCMLDLNFHVSEIHRTLTWTTGSLSCIHDNSCVYVYKQGLGTPTVSQHNIIIDSEKLTNFSCALDGIWTFILWIKVQCSTNWATPSPPSKDVSLVKFMYLVFIACQVKLLEATQAFVVVRLCSMCDVNCSSTITSYCLLVGQSLWSRQ